MKIVNGKKQGRDPTMDYQPSTKYLPGQVLITSIIFLAVILILSAALFSTLSNFINFGSRSTLSEQAHNLAEAGIEKTLWQLNETAGSYSGETNTALGTVGTFTVTIEDKSESVKTITSTGYVPNNSSPRAKRKIKVDAALDGQSVSFHYAVQTGIGGLSMANSSRINGNVYSNGAISGSGTSTIDGDAFAVGTISSPNPLVTGTKHPNSSPAPLPTVDYNFWKSQANINSDPVTCSPTCNISSSGNIGPKKYIGNLTIGNNAYVTLNGPIHVTGNFAIQQGGTIVKLNDNFGSNGTVVIVDGKIDYTQGGTFLPTNSTPKGFILVVTTSTESDAIKISQSGATAIFYALDGGAELSQSAEVSALAAKSLSMSQSAELTYTFGLASNQFTSGPGASWVIKRGSYKFNAN